MSKTILSVRNLTVCYGSQTVIHNLSFDLAEGESLGLIGPNGSGKSTLLTAILGFLSIAKGHIEIGGRNLGEMSPMERARLLAYVPQDSSDLPNFRVREFLELGQYPWHDTIDSTERLENLASAIENLGLTELQNKLLSQLSGGQRQRILLAQSLIQAPQVLLLDEITNHLDIHHQAKIMRQLQSLSTSRVMALHDLNLAARNCDRLLLMSSQGAYHLGRPEEILQPELIADLYQVQVHQLSHPDGGIWLAFD